MKVRLFAAAILLACSTSVSAQSLSPACLDAKTIEASLPKWTSLSKVQVTARKDATTALADLKLLLGGCVLPPPPVVTTPPPPAPTVFVLTVVNGSGGGSYAAGAVVTLVAQTPPSTETFAAWTGASVASATSATTTLTMPATATTVTATYAAVVVTTPPPTVPPSTPPPSGALLQPGNLVREGAFNLPHSTLGSTWGFGSYAGCCGLGTYAMTFNPAHNSIFIGGHPYEQRIAEIKIPASFAGTPIATAISNLIDPLEGKLSTINPSDPNQKILSSALVYNDQLYLGALSYYDGAVSQSRSAFVRPLDLTVKGLVVGPVKIGSQYPGWVDRYAALVPTEWQAALGGPALACGGGGAINGAQSWGPSCSSFDPQKVGNTDPTPATMLMGYPIGHQLANTLVGNSLWSQADVLVGSAIIGRTLVIAGKHGMGPYCYGTGAECGDGNDGSKGTHAFPYRSQIWAYDLNDLAAVRSGAKNPYDVKPYATWELVPNERDVQGIAFDPIAKRLYVSIVNGDSAFNNQPSIAVYKVQ